MHCSRPATSSRAAAVRAARTQSGGDRQPGVEDVGARDQAECTELQAWLQSLLVRARPHCRNQRPHQHRRQEIAVFELQKAQAVQDDFDLSVDGRHVLADELASSPASLVQRERTPVAHGAVGALAPGKAAHRVEPASARPVGEPRHESREHVLFEVDKERPQHALHCAGASPPLVDGSGPYGPLEVARRALVEGKCAPERVH